ncbi:MAG: hypothetical protein V4749_08870 [Pseudomonadota bacterium]
MPTPTKEEMIRASDSIKHSVAKLEETFRTLASQGQHEEAQALEASLKELKASLSRIRVCDEGKVRIVH